MTFSRRYNNNNNNNNNNNRLNKVIVGVNKGSKATCNQPPKVVRYVCYMSLQHVLTMP